MSSNFSLNCRSMDTFLKIQCIECNQMAQVREEKKQEQLLQASLCSSRFQHFNEVGHIPNYQDSLSKKVRDKKKAFGHKLSLKIPKKNDFISKELCKSQSKQNLDQIRAQYRFKSPKPKVTINYRSSPFTPSFIEEKSPENDILYCFKANIFKLTKIDQKFELNYRNEKQQFVQIGQQEDKKSREQFKQQKKQSVTLSKNQNSNTELKDNQEINVIRKKKVNFTQFKQNQGGEEEMEKKRENFSAFGSIANLNQHISIDDTQSYTSNVKIVVQTNKNITKILQIEDKGKSEFTRIVKKNMTFFKEGQKKFIGVKTVYTLKSMDNPSERSFLDLNYMQNLENGIRNKFHI